MFWVSFLCVIVVILVIVNLKLDSKCEQELKNSLVYCEDKMVMVFYDVSSKLLKCYETFKEDTKELEAVYWWLLSLKKNHAEGKDGLNNFFEKWRKHLIKEKEELEKLDKSKYEHGKEIYNRNVDRFNICYENSLDGEFFDYDKLLIDIEHIIKAVKLFDEYFTKIEKEKKLLYEKIENLHEKNNFLIGKENAIAEENGKINVRIAEFEKRNNTLYTELDKIKKESEGMKRQIRKIKEENLTLEAECKQLLREHRKLKNATTDWKYF